MPDSPKDRLLMTLDAHARHGSIVDVAIDALLNEARVAKASLYQHFGSKDALLMAWLDSRQQFLMQQFAAYVRSSSRPTDPAGEVDAAFGFLEVWLARPDFAGCPFLTTVLQLKDPANPVGIRARWYSDELLNFFRQRLEALEAPDPLSTATHLLSLYLGAIVVQELGTGRNAAATARHTALRLMTELPKHPPPRRAATQKATERKQRVGHKRRTTGSR